MSVFKRIFGIGVTKKKQPAPKTQEKEFGKIELTISNKPLIDKEYDLDPWNVMRIEVLQMALNDLTVDLTTYERGQYLEIVFSHSFYKYFIKLLMAKTEREEMKEKLKLYVLNRVLPEHQLN